MIPTPQQIEALASAMQSVLDDMGVDRTSTCRATKAVARRAFEPFREMLEDDGEGYMPLAEAEQICAEAGL